MHFYKKLFFFLPQWRGASSILISAQRHTQKELFQTSKMELLLKVANAWNYKSQKCPDDYYRKAIRQLFYMIAKIIA